MGRGAVRWVVIVAGVVVLALWALFNVADGIGAWWVVSKVGSPPGQRVVVTALIALGVVVAIRNRLARRR